MKRKAAESTTPNSDAKEGSALRLVVADELGQIRGECDTSSCNSVAVKVKFCNLVRTSRPLWHSNCKLVMQQSACSLRSGIGAARCPETDTDMVSLSCLTHWPPCSPQGRKPECCEPYPRPAGVKQTEPEGLRAWRSPPSLLQNKQVWTPTSLTWYTFITGPRMTSPR